MTDTLNDVPAKVRDLHRDLLMMQHITLGHPYKQVAASYGVSPRTCSRRVKDIASEMMRQAMEQTQGDPDHPAQVRWTVEEFCADSRGCMMVMMKHHLAELEREHPQLDPQHNAHQSIGGPG